MLVHTGNTEQAVAEMNKALRLDLPAGELPLLAGVVFYTAWEYAGDPRWNRRATPYPTPNRRTSIWPRPMPTMASRWGRAGGRQPARLFPATNLTYYGISTTTGVRRTVAILTGLRKAGITDWPFGFEGRDADRLDGAQLATLINNQTWVGKHKNGTDFLQYFDKAGNTAYRSANTTITGTARLDGDRLCQRFEGYFLDHTICGYVFRNSA